MAGGGIDWNSQVDEARQNASGVGFDNWHWLVKGKRCDGVCGVFSYSRELLHLVNRFWEATMMSAYDGLGSSPKISGAGVVAQPLPGVKNVTLGSPSQHGEIGKSLEPLIITRHRGRDLRLLEHEFGNEDRVGIARPAPGKIAAVAAIPAHEGGAEGQGVFRDAQDLSQCSTLNVGRSTLNSEDD